MSRKREGAEGERQTVSVCLYTQWKRIFHGIRTDIIHDGGRRQAAPSFSVAWHLGSALADLNRQGDPLARSIGGKTQGRRVKILSRLNRAAHDAKWRDRLLSQDRTRKKFPPSTF